METMSAPSTVLRRELGLRDMVLFNVAAVVSIRWLATAAHIGPGSLGQTFANENLRSVYRERNGILHGQQGRISTPKVVYSGANGRVVIGKARWALRRC